MTHKLSSLLAMDELAQILVEVVDDWKKTHGNPFTIKKQIFEKLDETCEHIILSATGLKKKYSGVGYEVTGDGTFESWVKQTANDAIVDWIKENINKLPELSIADTETINAIFKKEYVECLKAQVKNAAAMKANEDASELRKLLGSGVDELNRTANALLNQVHDKIEEKPKIKFRVFDTRGTLSSASFICPVHIDGDKVGSVDIENPTNKDVWFLVRISSSISQASAYIVTDCKEFLPCRAKLVTGEDGVWVDETDSRILENFGPSGQVFNLMNEVDMAKINEAVNSSV